MRTILIIITLLVAVTSILANDEYKKNAQVALKKCLSDEGASEDDVKSLKDKELPATTKGKSVLACMLETAGIIKDNRYVPDGVYAVLDKYLSKEPEKLAAGKKAAEECDKEVESYNGKDRGELAVTLISCFSTKAPGLNISPH